MLQTGQIGFRILPEFRGQRLAWDTCMALAPFVRLHYHQVILATDSTNIPSSQTIERLEAMCLGEILIPEHNPAWLEEVQSRLRYSWIL
jgi:RimJ/RimL family protein N-acetyltransferase